MKLIRNLTLSSIALSAALPAAAATISSDFDFGSGAPFGGSTTLGAVTVTLSSTVTEPFGATGFRDTTTDEDATVKFEFSAAISEFSLDVARVRNDEFLNSFSIGDPDSLSDDLVFTDPGVVGTTNTGDFNFGTLSWTGLNTTIIEFGISTASGAALALQGFSIDADPLVPTVPLPASLGFLGAGLLGLGTLARRRSSRA